MSKVAVIMGSLSDFSVMEKALPILDHFQITHDVQIISAHRTPEKMLRFAQSVYSKGYRVIIAGAGGAAHLPGMVAASTILPVIGVPIKASISIAGIDSLLSIVQMPSDIPVATVGINNAHNAALLAIQILAIANNNLHTELEKYQTELQTKVAKMQTELNALIVPKNEEL